MCGINGIVRFDHRAPPIDEKELLRTRAAMRQRGPDGHGHWISDDGNAALAHRRLSIIDLSDAGAQPMASADGRYHIVYNGEIYNFRELRNNLKNQGVRFRSESDTEVLLALWHRRGEHCVQDLRGMYAFAIWDDNNKELILARDPYGIKPLYYTSNGAVVRFASQLRALEAGGQINTEVSPQGLVGFLLWGSVPEPWTIRRGTYLLPAGSVLRMQSADNPRPTVRFNFVTRIKQDPEVDMRRALEESVRDHLVSDVPVGVYLSAGLDSALITALAKKRTLGRPLHTFTIRFESQRGTAQDEGPLAAEVATALGTTHHEWLVDQEALEQGWSEALEAMDQPTIDGLNVFLVSELAHREGFKVCLSGLGGDELFGSYPSFTDVHRWRRWARRLYYVPGLTSAWPHFCRLLDSRRPKLKGFFEHGRTTFGSYFLRRGLFLPQELEQLLGADYVRQALARMLPIDAASELDDLDAFNAVHILESTKYMRNQLLRDADWAAMAHSLELRVPLVDWRLRQAALSASRGTKAEVFRSVLNGAGKGLPEAIFARAKTGFTVPLGQVATGGRDGAASRRLGLGARAYASEVLRAFGVSIAE